MYERWQSDSESQTPAFCMQDGNTCITVASVNGFSDVVNALLTAGARVNTQIKVVSAFPLSLGLGWVVYMEAEMFDEYSVGRGGGSQCNVLEVINN